MEFPSTASGTKEFLVVSLGFQELLTEDFIKTYLYIPTLSLPNFFFPFNPQTAVYCCRMEVVMDFLKHFCSLWFHKDDRVVSRKKQLVSRENISSSLWSPEICRILDLAGALLEQVDCLMVTISR